jgi:acetyl-CoA decarbonylase/synthase complex subunit gamma
MALKGTDIVKKLPEGGKKNCKECGFPTCFAFAMKLATGGAALEKCHHLPPEFRAELAESMAPAIRLVTLGAGPQAVQVGNEEVIYRHEKAFFHPPVLGLLVEDTLEESAVEAEIGQLKALRFERVGKQLGAELLALRCVSGDWAKYLWLVEKAKLHWEGPLMLVADDAMALKAAFDVVPDRNPVIYPVTPENADRIAEAFKGLKCVIGARAKGAEALAALTQKLKALGFEDIVIDPQSANLIDGVRDGMLIRRAALKQAFRPLGYPILAMPALGGRDPAAQAVLAAGLMVKHAAVVVLSGFDAEALLPLLVQRLNIFTDPRVPNSVQENIYAVNGPDENAPALLTANWALTYFIVNSELEGTRIPAWLCVKNTEGLGVLVAWAAGKFTGATIADYVQKSGLEQKIRHRRLIIPGKVARIRNDLQEKLPGWEIIVGPPEAGELPAFLPKLIEQWRHA